MRDVKLHVMTNCSTLDYDTMVDKYEEFTLTATDHGDPALSGTATVRVWVENVNDQAPVMDPATPQIA